MITIRHRFLGIAVAVFTVGVLMLLILKVVGLEREVSILRQQKPHSAQHERLRRERQQAEADLAKVLRQAEPDRRDASELHLLRGQVTQLRQASQEVALLRATNTVLASAATAGSLEPWLQSVAERVNWLKAKMEQTPGQMTPELQWADEQDWFKAARELKSGSEKDVMKSLAKVRTLAKEKIVPVLQKALRSYTEANQGQLPTEMAELKPFCEQPVDDAILQRFQLRQSGNINDKKPVGFIINERERLSPYDSIHLIGLDGSGSNTVD